MFPLLSAIFTVLLVLSASAECAVPTSQRVPKADRFPRMDDEPQRPKPGAAAVAGKRRIFGIGVGFERSGTLVGVALSLVLPGSPAARSGLVAGCVIVEVNGTPTVGRTGEDCASLIRDSVGPVRIKILDPALKEKVLTLDKEWLVVPD